MNQRNNGADAKNSFVEFLDVHYDDETMHKIYASSKSVEENK